MAVDFSFLNESIRDTFGDSYTYLPVGGFEYAITGVRDSGDRLEALSSGAHAALHVLFSDMQAEPTKGDSVLVPAGREIAPGYYRVIDVGYDDADGRTLYLNFSSTP